MAIKDLSALVDRYEAKIAAKPEKESVLQAKLDAKIAKQISKGNTVQIDGATVTSYNLGETSSGGGGGGTTGSSFTLTADTQNQNFSSYSNVSVTVNGDDDAAEGDEFDVTLSSGNDTLTPDTWLRLDVNAGSGTDTLDLREIGKDGVDADEADVNLQTGVAHPDVDATFVNFENVYASELGGRLVGTTGANIFYLGEGTDDIEAAGGDDTIIADDSDLLDAADDFDGGSGTDTLVINGDDTLDLDGAVDVITNIEKIVIGGTDNDDVTLDVGELFDSTLTTTAIVGGITNITIEDEGDLGHTVQITAAGGTDDINLIGVTFTNVATLDVDAGAGNDVRIDSNSLAGVETLDGIAGENLVTKGGTYDLSEVTFVGMTELIGSTTSSDTIKLGLDNGTLADMDGGSSSGDVLTFANTDVSDLSAYTRITDFETLEFGSATSVVLDHENGTAGTGTMYSVITGTTGESDTLTFSGGNVAVTNTSISGVESIVLDNGGAAATLTIGTTTLGSGVTVIGDSSASDEIVLGASGVDVSSVDFRDFEFLDFNTRTASITTETFAKFSHVDGDDNGALTFTNSGTVVLSTNSANHTGDAQYQFHSGDDNLTFRNFDDNGCNVDVRLGAGNDTVTVSSGNTLTGSEVSLDAGDDIFVMSDVDVPSGLVSGGEGTDTLRITDASVVAADLAAADFIGFEKVAFGAASTAALSFELTSAASTLGITTVDFSGDTSATGANTLDLDGYTSTLTITGSAGADTIRSGTGTNTIDGGGGADTIQVTGSNPASSAAAKVFTLTGGAGVDTYSLSGNVHNDSTASDTVVITDYATGEDILLGNGVVAWNPVADIANGDVVEMDQSVAQAIVNGSAADGAPGSLTVALNRISNYVYTADNANDILVTAFQYNGDTYVYVDGSTATGDYAATSDFYLKLTGIKTVNMTDVTVTL